MFTVQAPADELQESLAGFDVEGDGLVALSQIRHLVTDPASGSFHTQTTNHNTDCRCRRGDHGRPIQQAGGAGRRDGGWAGQGRRPRHFDPAELAHYQSE